MNFYNKIDLDSCPVLGVSMSPLVIRYAHELPTFNCLWNFCLAGNVLFTNNSAIELLSDIIGENVIARQKTVDRNAQVTMIPSEEAVAILLRIFAPFRMLTSAWKWLGLSSDQCGLENNSFDIYPMTLDKNSTVVVPVAFHMLSLMLSHGSRGDNG